MVVLRAQATDAGYLGWGRSGARSFVFVERPDRTIEGTLIFADGEETPVLLGLLPDQAAWMEVRGTTVSLQPVVGQLQVKPSGPFTGTFRSTGLPSVLDRMSLLQNGSSVGGTAAVTGEPAIIAGEVVGGDLLRGLVRVRGGLEVSFEAALQPNGDLLLRGLGEVDRYIRE
jgi:hypothetical protein